MSRTGRHILLTGAGGFIGSRLAECLLAEPDFADCRVTLLDLRLPHALDRPRVRCVEGDFGDAAIRAHAVDGRADIIYHLAGVLGGAAEADYRLARCVNVDATLDLLETLRNADRPPRLIFASSIAVFGPEICAPIDDDTMPLPVLNYGAQKRMMEIAIEQFSARGWIDGLAMRLPGIVARRDADARLQSAFLNTLFFDYAHGRSFTLPVSPDGTTWMISVAACVEAFVHAARLSPHAIGARRAFTLPAQRVRIDALIAALGQRFPDSASRVTYAPDRTLENQFARQPALATAIGDRLGFRHDGTLDRLIERAML